MKLLIKPKRKSVTTLDNPVLAPMYGIPTSVRLPFTATSLPAPEGKPVPPNLPSDNWSSIQAASFGSPPLNDPPVLEIDQDFNPVVGIYLLAAPTGAGKTILSMALAGWANHKGVAARYIGCFEPRTRPYSVMNTSRFSKPQNFWDDVVAACPIEPNPSLVILDSATLPMKAYAKNFPNQSTFTGGMQPSDRGFIDRGTDIAYARNRCFILDMNSTLVPYITDLAGSTEGIIQLESISTFRYQDRTSASGRQDRSITIPDPFVQAALNYFGFGELKKSGTRVRRGFLGVRTRID